MTEVEVYQPHDTPAIVAPVSGNELEVMIRQADLLSQSDIIPKDYRRKPANILVAAMTGRTFGWDVMTAMRNGHVIEGVWGLKPEASLGLIRKAGHSVKGTKSSTGAKIRGKRADNGDEMEIEFTLDDAVRAGLCRIKDGRPYARSSTGRPLPWEQYPQAMCWWRAVSQLARDLFSDVTLGLSYTPEELGAQVGPDGDVVESPPALAPAQEGPFKINPDNVEALRQRCAERGLDVAEVVSEGTGDEAGNPRTDDPAEVFTHEIPAIKAAMDALADEPVQAEVVEEKTYAPDDPERPFDEPGETVDSRIDPDRPLNAYSFGIRAHDVFEAAIDPERIPRGKKTWLLRALRHALIYACTDGEASGAKDANGSQLFAAWGLLDDIESGAVTFEFNAAPTQGVTFTWVDQSTTSVKWTELTLAEADAEVERRAGAA